MRSKRTGGPARIELVVILGALSAFGPLSMDAYLPGLPRLTRELGASASAGQLTVTTCMVGLALGQVLAGPLSDRFGRRGPLITGVAGYAIASAACAAAPSMATLILLRLLQGLAGGAGIVVARAIVRDRFQGDAVARLYATLTIVTGVAPILAPLVGGQMLRFTSWRGIFAALALTGLALVAVVVLRLPESLGVAQRRPGHLGETFRPLGSLLRDRTFTGTAAAFALAFGAMFANIAGAPFVLENVYHLSPQTYSLVFALNAGGLVGGSQLGRRLIGRRDASTLFRFGLLWVALASVGTLVVTISHAGLAPLLVSLFVLMSAGGLALPMGTAAAMASQEQLLGSASALLGLGQFGFGSIVAPLVGLGGPRDALPMAVVIAACGACAFATGRLSVHLRSPEAARV